MAMPTRLDLRQTSRLFHALADPTRLGILQTLSRGEHCVCELTDHLDSAQSRLSFHLKTLKDAGVVVDRKDGRWVHYRLDPEALAAMAEFIEELADTVPDRRCCM